MRGTAIEMNRSRNSYIRAPRSVTLQPTRRRRLGRRTLGFGLRRLGFGPLLALLLLLLGLLRLLGTPRRRRDLSRAGLLLRLFAPGLGPGVGGAALVLRVFGVRHVPTSLSRAESAGRICPRCAPPSDPCAAPAVPAAGLPPRGRDAS